jgi:hypothetical protein
MQDLMLSLLMLCSLGLIAGAIALWRRGGPMRKVWLMLLAAAVMLANVAIWIIPTTDGSSPMEQAEAMPG